MIEITYTEIVLFTWAVIATGFAIKNKHDGRIAFMLLQKVVETPSLYKQMHESWKDANA